MTGTASARRAATLQRFADSSRPFDVLVVGGGATGAATARDAAVRGLDVGLCEAGDFAGETSGKSSKLLHGGLRYLQYGDFQLVYEGLTERRRLMRTAPHLCRPIEFLFPGYRGERPGLGTLGIGISLYNALALWRPPAGASRRLTAEALGSISPFLRTAGLLGARGYVDCQTDDARLVLENVLDAAGAGAAVANHVAAEALLRDRRGRVRGATLQDRETGARFDARARLVVSATGPFTDSFPDARATPRLRPTLGVHLVFDAARLPHHGRAFVLRSPRDNRLFFVLPADARTLVGTTDTDWSPGGGARRPPRLGDDIRARGADVGYLLEALNHAFPALRLGPEDVVSTFAALRPLLATQGHTPSQTSREHEITVGVEGPLTVTGGKLTTLRRMGEEVVDRALEVLRAGGFEGSVAPCTTASRPLPGGVVTLEPLEERDRYLGAGVAARLTGAYGARTGQVLAIIAEAPLLAARIDPQLPYLWAEVVHAARHDHARTVSDALARRIPLLRDATDQGLAAAPRAGALIAAELGWTTERQAASVSDYQALVDRTRRWRAEI